MKQSGFTSLLRKRSVALKKHKVFGGVYIYVVHLLFYCPRHRASTFTIRVYDIWKVWVNVIKKMPEKDFPNKRVTGF